MAPSALWFFWYFSTILPLEIFLNKLIKKNATNIDIIKHKLLNLKSKETSKNSDPVIYKLFDPLNKEVIKNKHDFMNSFLVSVLNCPVWVTKIFTQSFVIFRFIKWKNHHNFLSFCSLAYLNNMSQTLKIRVVRVTIGELKDKRIVYKRYYKRYVCRYS